MIKFNELIIVNEQNLIIDVSVKELSYYTDVYIDSITIDTQDTFIESGPSSKPVYTKTIEGNNKSIRLELNKGDLLPSLKDNLFFVFIKTKGTPSSDTPCGMDNITTIGVVYNLKIIYSTMMCFLRQVESNCTIGKNFIDSLLRYKAFELSIKTSNYPLSIKYWNRYLSNKADNYTYKNCSCYE